MPTLFEPLRIGDVTLTNRIVMAPLTRRRAGKPRTGNPLVAEYYAQRASSGLIITEATSVSPMAVGHEHTPGIWTDEQVAGWKLVTDAVHRAGGIIFMQLWHVGRVSDPVFLDGRTPISCSAIAPEGSPSLVRPKRPFTTPRALHVHEIAEVIEEYRRAAHNAMKAGFDGVELHGANGYLPDQFLQDGANKRTDEYGGPVENRARFMLEVVDALVSVWGPDRVGLHLSPRGTTHSVFDSAPEATWGFVAAEANRRKLAFLFVREPLGESRITPMIRQAFDGVLIANQGLTQQTAQALLDSGEADAAAFGVPFIANPDLPCRFELGAPLAAPRVELYYEQGSEGYVDYPAYEPVTP